ncbi:hypothetical protein LEMLEM_LOCUS2873, partial [Lemmus lemmus]
MTQRGGVFLSSFNVIQIPRNSSLVCVIGVMAEKTGAGGCWPQLESRERILELGKDGKKKKT